MAQLIQDSICHACSHAVFYLSGVLLIRCFTYLMFYLSGVPLIKACTVCVRKGIFYFVLLGEIIPIYGYRVFIFVLFFFALRIDKDTRMEYEAAFLFDRPTLESIEERLTHFQVRICAFTTMMENQNNYPIGTTTEIVFCPPT